MIMAQSTVQVTGKADESTILDYNHFQKFIIFISLMIFISHPCGHLQMLKIQTFKLYAKLRRKDKNKLGVMGRA